MIRKSSIIVAALLLNWAGAPNAAAVTLYGATHGGSSGASELYAIDTTTGATTLVGPIGYSVNGLESFQGTLYATTSRNDPSFHGLLVIDPATGAGTPVGTGWGGSITSLTLAELAIDSAGNAYSWGEPYEDDLYAVDLAAGTAARVGNSGLNTAAFTLAFDSADVLWLLEWNSATRINPLTGAVTGTFSGANEYEHHGDTNPSTGELWALRGFGGAAGSGSIDVFDFADFTTVLQNVPLDRGIHALAFAEVCGDGEIDPAETCDDGAANGTTASCCSDTCTFVAAGSGCDDSDACTQLDECDGTGQCVGSDPVVCTPIDQCHEAGTCDPSSGSCDDPAKPDDTACDDSDACTLYDSCQAGTCEPGGNTLLEPLAAPEQTVECVLQTVESLP